MKITTLLVLLAVSGISASTYAQNFKVSLKKQDASILEILKEIEHTSEFTFFFNDNQVDVNKKASINVKDASLEEVLDEVLKNAGYTYQVIDRQVLINVGNKSVAMVNQQKRTITGIVTDVNGEPIIGANVVIKGSTNGTITDLDGKFTMEAEEGTILQVSFIGYIIQDVPAKKTNLTITLRDDTQKLDEVVVVGYGTQKKVTLTGAVSAIAGDDILTTKNENVKNMLSGKVPGVRVVQKTGEPGSYSSDFQIRGMGHPLIIIDGVPRDNMDRLDPNEIESLSVLKDASAAIYGVRASNGVVLITTKRGKGGRIQLDYSGSVGWQQATNFPETLNGWEWMTLSNENSRNKGGDILYSQEDIESYKNGTKQDTDWARVGVDVVAPQTQHSFSATGNTEKVDYFVNFGYLDQQGFWSSGDLNYQRFNVRSNISGQITKNLRVEVLLNAMKDTKNRPYCDTWEIYKGAWMQSPLHPVYANNNPMYLQNVPDALNQIATTNSDISGYRKENTKLFQGTFNLLYDVPFIKGLKAKAMYSYDYQIWDAKEQRKEYSLYDYNADTDTYRQVKAYSPSTVNRSFREYESSLLQLSLNYDRTFNEVHHVNILALYEENTMRMDNFFAKRELSLGTVDELFAGNTTNQTGSMNSDGFNPEKGIGEQNGIWKIANKGFVGRVNYDYASKYMAEFSFRYDGSSKFAPGNQWGFFPAASVGWRLSEESFFKETESLKFVNNLKLRASYGKMGDDSSSSYQFVSGSDYPTGGYYFNGSWTNGLKMRGLANQYITWFTSKTLNVGLDGDLWNGLLSFQFDIFTRDRDGLLANRNLSLPGTVGAGLPQENLEGDLTKGFELALSHRNKIGDVGYFFNGNISLTRTRWQYKETSQKGNSYRNWRENETDRYSDLWWGYGYVGQFVNFDQIMNTPIQDEKGNSIYKPGDYVYEDWNGDGMIDDNDIHPIATKGFPQVNFGFTVGADYKGIDLNLLFQGTARGNVRYPGSFEKPLDWDRNGLRMFMDRWHLEDPTADPKDPNSKWIPGYYPSTQNGGENTNYRESERSVQNASYLRLKSVEIGYTIPPYLLRRIGVQKLRVYVNAYNLLTFTSLENLDPERTMDTYGCLYPLTKTYNVGVNVSF